MKDEGRAGGGGEGAKLGNRVQGVGDVVAGRIRTGRARARPGCACSRTRGAARGRLPRTCSPKQMELSHVGNCPPEAN